MTPNGAFRDLPQLTPQVVEELFRRLLLKCHSMPRLWTATQAGLRLVVMKGTRHGQEWTLNMRPIGDQRDR